MKGPQSCCGSIFYIFVGACNLSGHHLNRFCKNILCYPHQRMEGSVNKTTAVIVVWPEDQRLSFFYNINTSLYFKSRMYFLKTRLPSLSCSLEIPGYLIVTLSAACLFLSLISLPVTALENGVGRLPCTPIPCLRCCVLADSMILCSHGLQQFVLSQKYFSRSPFLTIRSLECLLRSSSPRPRGPSHLLTHSATLTKIQYTRRPN